MSIEAHRWLMKAIGEPMERALFDAQPGPGEVAVAVAGCGVCHTDLGYYYDGVRTKHALPLALGHEVSGRVVGWGAGPREIGLRGFVDVGASVAVHLGVAAQGPGRSFL